MRPASRVRAWVDGGARGNPGPAGYGVVLTDAEGVELARVWGFLGEATNNVAEYRGLIAALEEASRLGAEEIEIRTDSELVQRQITGVYKIRQPHLRELAASVRKLAARFRAFAIHHVPREKNRKADTLANRAIDERSGGRESPLAC
jgi:ribonuclease HI